MWLISTSIRNHANSNSHCEKVHITSVVGKRHNFTHFYIYYATKNWNLSQSNLQESAQNCQYRPNVNILGLIALIIRLPQSHKFGKLCGILGIETPVLDSLLFF